jgi:methylmalonyl-CoA/ethylmalonyl-CoA epimerase
LADETDFFLNKNKLMKLEHIGIAVKDIEKSNELLEASSPDSPIAKFIEKKGEGIHHMAFEVSDIDAEIKRLSERGFTLIHSVAKDGADNKRIAFLHPKSTNGVLIELCQEKG